MGRAIELRKTLIGALNSISGAEGNRRVRCLARTARSGPEGTPPLPARVSEKVSCFLANRLLSVGNQYLLTSGAGSLFASKSRVISRGVPKSFAHELRYADAEIMPRHLESPARL